MPPGGLSRDELIELIERILSGAAATEEEDDQLVEQFTSSVVHPQASDLIFHPRKHFNEEPTAEQIVDAALAYKPFAL